MATNPKRTRGRPPKFTSPEHLQHLFAEWQVSFGEERKDEIPDIEGFCDFVDAYRDILSEYESKKDYSDTIKRIRNWIYFKKKQLAMQNKMNPTIFIFDAKNNAGYVDKQEVDNHHSGEVSFVNDVPRPKR
jgi:hypothetical protein